MSWPLVEFGEVATFINGDRGKNYPSKGSFIKEGVPFISAGNLSGEELNPNSFNYISEERYNLLSNGKVKENDILFCLRGSLGKFAVVKGVERGAIASSLVIIRNNEKITLNFLKHYLSSPLCQREINQFENGAAQPNLSAKDLKSFKIPLPPLDEQKRIAAILDKADAIRRNRQQAIQLADDFLRSVFLNMFGDPIANNKKWDVANLGELAPNKGDMVDGPFGSSVNTKTDYIEHGEIPVIRTKNVSLAGEFISNDLKFMTRDKYLTIHRSNVVPGDIVLTKVGTIGNVCIFPEQYKEAVLSTTGSCRIRVDESKINKTYLFYFLKYYRPKMHEIASTGVQPFLNMKHIKGFQVPMPERELQNKFDTLVQKVATSQKLFINASKEKLFDSLSQKAFSGEL